MLIKIILAAVYAVIVYVVCVFIGGLLATVSVPIAEYVGGFLVTWATAFSILAFIYFAVTGTGTLPWRKTP